MTLANSPPREAPFGTVLGIAPGDVPVYSSNYEEGAELLDRHDFISVMDEVYMGYKWQCVELARRWLYCTRGVTFEEVGMAYEIFELRQWQDKERQALPVRAFRNGSRRPPEPGCLLIWDEGGEFAHTGHVAVVTEVREDCVLVVEQNYHNDVWPEGQHHSRKIPLRQAYDGGAWVRCPSKEGTILGWVIQTDDGTYAQPIVETEAEAHELVVQKLSPAQDDPGSWLNEANPDEAAYVHMMGGHTLVSDLADEGRWVALSTSLHRTLRRATHDLHVMFMHATDWVLQDPEQHLVHFDLPRALWPRLAQSWAKRKNHMITGRFDFCASGQDLKVYEYNCDSASCYMECGKVQGAWARHHGVTEGEDAGKELFALLVEAWQDSEVDATLHIMYDDHLEEAYHALYMRDALETAGVQTKALVGVEGLRFGPDREVLDADGEPIRWVWKTWAWETALDQIRAECEADELGERRDASPRLADVLLDPNVRVFEPLWTLIPSNKAILPVLWKLFPNHPFLLESQFELTETLRQSGYVVKPIVGRCGANIAMYEQHDALMTKTTGQFDARDMIYQQMSMLPALEGSYVQLCTFCVGGVYAGACTRVDHSPIIKSESDIWPLRVMTDKDHAEMVHENDHDDQPLKSLKETAER